MKLKKLFPLTLITLATFSVNAQNETWVEVLERGGNFYEVQEAFNREWEGREYEKGKGHKQYKRWEYFTEPRVYPSGDISLLNQTRVNYQQYLEDRGIPMKAGNEWFPLGPSDVPSGGGGAGRLTFVKEHPNNPNNLFVGTPNGGLWESTDGGLNWTVHNDFLDVIGCSDLVFDPVNPDIRYLSTGDNDHVSTYTIGVLKSTDAGATWNPTGLNFTVNQQRRIYKLHIDPTNGNNLVAVTSTGIRKSTDAGATWNIVHNGNVRDIEYNPQNPNTLFATSTTFMRSFDGGDTWTNGASGLPTGGVSRMAVAVTAADTSVVYILAGANDNGLQGIYKSTDGGTSFTQVADNNPNYLDWSTTGSGSGGQAWYDLALGVSPTDADEVWIGGVNVWKSTNGGAAWEQVGHWYGGGGKPYVHADIHEIKFSDDGTKVYIANDGGIMSTINGGNSYTELSNGLNIAQIYRMGQGVNENQVITGHQDNGSNLMTGSSWARVVGGDGMDCFIDQHNPSFMYASVQYGSHRRSTNGGASFSQILGSIPDGDWVSPIYEHPTIDGTIYVGGRDNLYISTDYGNNASGVSTLYSGTFKDIIVSQSNPDVICAIQGNRVIRSDNGGANFYSINGGIAGQQKQDVAIDPANPDNIIVVVSGYSNGNKVYQSTNGGQSFTNISAGLPNVPFNCVFIQPNTDMATYVGCDVGVFYRDSLNTTWVPLDNGLPVTEIMDIEYHEPSNKIRVATYGRGVWETQAIDVPSYEPIANFSQDENVVCEGGTIQFSDESINDPVTYSWVFNGGTPSTSSDPNPVVTYATAGTYDVSLTVTNSSGTDSKTQSNAVTVNDCLGLDEEEQMFSVYPNPAKSELYIQGTGKVLSVEMFDMNGKRVSTRLQVVSDEMFRLSWNDIANGTYRLLISDGDQTVSKSLIVK